ncbi:MAG: CHY zinc finger protein [Gemmatimonadota bacterium]|nr:CHY zinc finger protein [Gemmatimonadota bacterium]
MLPSRGSGNRVSGFQAFPFYTPGGQAVQRRGRRRPTAAASHGHVGSRLDCPGVTDGSQATEKSPRVHGLAVDAATRCAHYHGELDILAIRVSCCGEFYACKDCHDAIAGHQLKPWPREAFETSAILCGACGSKLSITAYLECGNDCPECGAGFNPRCMLHHHFYFATR